MKENKGITLVALIITIIVMLILVGVTISAVVQSDIIGQGEEAAKAYENKQTEEQSLNFIIEGGKTIANYLNPSNEDEEVPNALKRFILGSRLEGRPLTDIMDMGSMTFKNLEDEPITDAETSIICKTFYGLNSSEYVLLIEYESKIYKFVVNLSTYETQENYGVVKIGAPITATSTTDVEVGSTISYDGKKWIVMNISNGEIEMISKDALKYNDGDRNDVLNLGKTDAICSSLTDGTDAFDEANLDGYDTLSDIEKSIYSYNHAIETLNSACASLITDRSKIAKDNNNNYKIRSVGSNPDDPNSENATPFTSTFLESHPTSDGEYNGVGKSTDTNFVSDFERLVQLGAEKAKYKEAYWLASRFVYEYSDKVSFGIRRVFGDYYICNSLCDVKESSATIYSFGCLVRPVVTLKSGLTFEYNSEDGGYFTIAE